MQGNPFTEADLKLLLTLLQNTNEATAEKLGISLEALRNRASLVRMKVDLALKRIEVR